MAFYPVTHRDIDIKVVIIGGFGRKIGNSDFSHRSLTVKFLLFVNVQNVLIDSLTSDLLTRDYSIPGHDFSIPG